MILIQATETGIFWPSFLLFTGARREHSIVSPLKQVYSYLFWTYIFLCIFIKGP
jgi:hypothetical protein